MVGKLLFFIGKNYPLIWFLSETCKNHSEINLNLIYFNGFKSVF